MMPIRVLMACALLCGGAATAQAQVQTPARTQAEDVALQLSLEDAIARGVEVSHRVEEAAARSDAADAVARQRQAIALPQVAALAGYTRTNHVDPFGIRLPTNQVGVIYPDLPDNLRTRLDVQWPLYTGGRLESGERAARAEAAASLSDIDAARGDVRLDTARAYWSLVTALEAVRVVDESLASMIAHVRDVRNQLDAGLVPPNDVALAEAQEARERVLSVRAHTAVTVAEADLARAIGLERPTRIEPTSSLEAALPEELPFDVLLAEARRDRPERAALERRIAAATERQRAAEAGLKPVIGVGGGVDYANPNPRIFPRQDAWQPSWDASVNLSWPVFDGGRAKSEIAEAAAGIRAARARLAEFDSTLSLDVQQRSAEVTSSRAAIDAADAGVRAATEARRVVGDRFDAGVATSTDVLDAQVALLQAALDRAQALANARLAEARLNRTLGR